MTIKWPPDSFLGCLQSATKQASVVAKAAAALEPADGYPGALGPQAGTIRAWGLGEGPGASFFAII